MQIQPVRRDDATGPFFDGTARGVFMLRKSASSGEILPPNAELDSRGDTDLAWIASSGLGRVVSWAFVPGRAPAEGTTPLELTIGIIELDEGPWWWTQLVDVDADDVVEGLRVRAVFPKSGPSACDEYVPVFEPVR